MPQLFSRILVFFDSATSCHIVTRLISCKIAILAVFFLFCFFWTRKECIRYSVYHIAFLISTKTTIISIPCAVPQWWCCQASWLSRQRGQGSCAQNNHRHTEGKLHPRRPQTVFPHPCGYTSSWCWQFWIHFNGNSMNYKQHVFMYYCCLGGSMLV